MSAGIPVARVLARLVLLALAATIHVDDTAAEVSSGMSRDLDKYRQAQESVAPPGYSLCDAVGVGIAGSNDHVYVWYRDGTVSSGTTRDLAVHRPPRPFTLPSGRWTGDIVAMAIAGSNDWVYAWYRDGTVSAGTSTDLTRYRPPQPYSLPPGKDPLSIVGMGIAGSNDRVFAWYDDGTVSSGSTTELDASTPPQAFSTAQGFSAGQIVDVDIAGSDDHVYAFYARCTPPGSEMLNVKLYPQETNQWCWAAIGQTTMRYVGNVDITQCRQANNRLARNDCCQTPTPAGCVLGGGPEYPKYGFSHKEPGALGWPDLRRQLANGGPFRGRPFGFSWIWLAPDASGKLTPSGGGHMMVAIGYVSSKAGDFVEVQDPWPPNQGDHRFDLYSFWRQDPADHVHARDYVDIRYTGGK